MILGSYRATTYLSPFGLRSIGWGKYSENITEINEEVAEKLLDRDVNNYISICKDYLRVKLNFN